MFKTFKVGELFDIHPTSAYKMKNDELFASDGTTPVLSNSSVNNGIGGYCGFAPTEQGGMITFSDTTTGADTMFYQSSPFIGYPHVQGMYPYQPDKWDEKCCLYVISCIRKSAGNGWNYAVKFNRALVKELSIELPVVESADVDHEYTVDDINYEYMQERIAEFEQERITELEQERIAELDAYLAASGLDDYELTDEDKAILTEDKPMREFVVGEVFEKLKSPFRGHQKKQESVSRVRTEEYSLPLINCKFGNNGIMYYGRPGDFTSYERVLGVIYNGPPTEGQTYYHEKAGVFTDAYLIGLKEQEIASREIGLYLTTALNKSIHNETRRRYSRGNKATWEGKVEADPILLPVTMNGDIDFDYMERYIRVIEKLAIADVAKYKDRLIATTKQVVGM